MKLTNALITSALIAANALAFFWGRYHTLTPIIYVSGLAFASTVYVWAATRMETRDLTVLTATSVILAFIDEYAHTTAEAFTYFDRMKPSLLTVFGWGLFIPAILTVAQLLHEKLPMERLGSGTPRTAPAMISILLLIACAWKQGYLPVFSLTLAQVYVLLGVASLYYTSRHPHGWNAWVMATSLVISALMESIGAMEGMWTFRFNEALPLFMVFTWALRTWTILAFSSLLGVELPKKKQETTTKRYNRSRIPE
jgi:hypothetical protein